MIEIADIPIRKSNKLTYAELNEVSRYIGERIVKNYTVAKIKEPKRIKTKGRKEEHSILDISDTHIGMVNEVFDSITCKKEITYNMAIFRQELEGLQRSVSNIHSILSHSYKLRDLTIFMLGDIITNDRIFPEQTFEIEKVVGLQMWDAVNYFSSFFRNLLQLYDKITVVGCVGNHGRSRDQYNEPVENNFEYHIYKIWEKEFADSKRIDIIVPNTRRYIHDICGWKHLIEHGDSIKGSSAMAIKKHVEQLYLNMGGFDVSHFGHFHSMDEFDISDNVIVKKSGCWIEKDCYGFSKFKTYSAPKQFFFGCNYKRPETWGYKIDLRQQIPCNDCVG